MRPYNRGKSPLLYMKKIKKRRYLSRCQKIRFAPIRGANRLICTKPAFISIRKKLSFFFPFLPATFRLNFSHISPKTTKNVRSYKNRCCTYRMICTHIDDAHNHPMCTNTTFNCVFFYFPDRYMRFFVKNAKK